jgi:hypothetical protein
VSIRYNSSFVREGLVLFLDADNIKSYPGSGSTWFDISGNNNHCTLNNLPTWNAAGYFSFNGSSNYGTITYSSTLNFSGGQTVLILINHSNTSGRPNPWNQAYGGSGTWTHEGGGSFNYYYGNAGTNNNPYTSLASGSTPTNTWYGMCSTRDISSIAWYQNATFQTSASNAYGNLASDTNNITIGIGYTGNYWAGNIALIMAYDRALNSTEVLTNYIGYRGRFNI